MKKFTSICLLTLVIASQTACWTTPSSGSVEIQTIWAKPNQVVRPPGIWTITTLGDDYHEISLRASTKESDVTASTKDNAALTIKVAATFKVFDNDGKIIQYANTFGFTSEEREARLVPILLGQLNTEVKNAIAGYDAYRLLASQEAIQKSIFDKLKPIFENQLFLQLESIQIIGRPDFLDDRIETAASAVIANSKLKEAAEAALAAARVDAERKAVESQTFAQSPALLKIRELELQKETAEAWARHQGTLVFGGSSPLFLNKD